MKNTLSGSLKHVTNISPIADEGIMGLDGFTLRNLEVFKSLATQGTHGTLIDLLDETVTNGGGRLLKQWLSRPLTDTKKLNSRLNIVAGFFSNKRQLKQCRSILEGIMDIERILGKINQSKVSPRDLIGLKQSLNKIPEKMAVIGGGVIGLELGSVYSRLGTEVTVLEYRNSITPEMDKDVSKNLQRILKQQGIKFKTNCAVSTIEKLKGKVRVNFINNKTESNEKIETEIVLVATGRKAYSNGLCFEEIGGLVDERGGIKTDVKNLTNVPSIYAIGDVTNGPMLAHKAEEEGIAVAETIAGQKSHINFNHIPNVIYTNPEVASVGMTEGMLKNINKSYKVGKFNFAGNARAKLVFSSAGFVKLLTDSKTDRILGCHIIGPNAGDIIHEVCVAMEFGASAQDLAMTCHAHPTFSEAIKAVSYTHLTLPTTPYV